MEIDDIGNYNETKWYLFLNDNVNIFVLIDIKSIPNTLNTADSNSTNYWAAQDTDSNCLEYIYLENIFNLPSN